MIKVSNIYDTIKLQGKSTTENIKRKYTNKGEFDNLLNRAIDDRSETTVKEGDRREDKKLMNVCIEMESLFVGRMLKAMRNTVHKNTLFHGGFAEEVFEDMLYDEYSLQLSKTANLGLAKMLYEELSRM